MNWLAHLQLARRHDDALLGALLGDFVRGRGGLDDWGRAAHVEIVLHRRIDVFTDSHPAVIALRSRFPAGRRRYAGIVLDVFFDHLLAQDWSRWDDAPLQEFAKRAYGVLERNAARLPAGLAAIAPRMARHDWLSSYARRASVDDAVTRMASRLSRGGDGLVATLVDLRSVEDDAAEMFSSLYADLQAFAQSERAAMTAEAPLRADGDALTDAGDRSIDAGARAHSVVRPPR